MNRLVNSHCPKPPSASCCSSHSTPHLQQSQGERLDQQGGKLLNTLALTPAWGPLHVPSAWTTLYPSPWYPLLLPHNIPVPHPQGEAGDSSSLTVSPPPLSPHGAFFVLLLYNLPCYTATSYSSLPLPLNQEAPWELRPRLIHIRDAQYVFGELGLLAI